MKNSVKVLMAGLAFAAASLPAAAQPPAFQLSVGTPNVGVSVGTGPAVAPAPAYCPPPAPAYYPPPPAPAYYPPPAYAAPQPAYYPPPAYAAPAVSLAIIAPSFAYARAYPQYYYFFRGRYYRHGYGPRYHNRYR